MAGTGSKHYVLMKLAVEDSKVYPLEVRQGSRLEKAWFEWGRLWETMLMSEFGVGLAVIWAFVSCAVPATYFGVVMGNLSGWWVLDTVPYALCTAGFFKGLSTEGLRSTSLTVTHVDSTLAEELETKIVALNRALVDCGLDDEAKSLVVKQVQATIVDAGDLAQAISEGKQLEGFDDTAARAQLHASVASISRIATDIEGLAVARLVVEAKRQAELGSVTKADKAARVGREAQTLTARLSAADQSLAALGEHIAEVAKAQKELVEQVGN